ncbi:hypothetical protein D3C85_443220 [compost metagenome]
MDAPAPIAGPLTAAISGIGRSASLSSRGLMWVSRIRPASSGKGSDRVPPAQKARPEPVSRIARAPEATAASTAASSASIIGSVRAFIRSG